ncbi:MAG: DeoR/GlpR transcriptional regulator [Burkholderiaceae bacterium]|nr:DeoR/GlpR transcriptional regulator [Microbacteriaceae bacterium]
MTEGDNTGDRPAGATREQRLTFVTELINREGFVGVDALAEVLGLSRMTVHRDLDQLQRDGVLRKVRGGASAHRSTKFESGVPFRSNQAVEQKRQIARAAADLASPGDVIILDASTTALEVLPHLLTQLPLTVITNFWTVLEKLEGKPDVNLVGLGGDYVHQYRAFLGVVCEKALGELYADVLFASVSALRGLDVYHQDQRIVSVKRAMMRSAGVRVLLLDHTKVGHGSLHRLGSVTEFTHVVVDTLVDAAVVDEIREAGVEVIVAPAS